MGQKAPPKRVVIYCRVSTDDQSYDRQEQDLKAYATKAGYQVIGIWGGSNEAVMKCQIE